MGILFAFICAVIFTLLLVTWGYLERYRKEYVFRLIFFHSCVFITYSLFFYFFRERAQTYQAFLAYAGLFLIQIAAFASVMLYDIFEKIPFKKAGP